MAEDYIFRLLFGLGFIAFLIIRAYYIRKTRDPNAPRSRSERFDALRKEGWTG